MASPWVMAKLIHQAGTLKANQPKAWDIGAGLALAYYEHCYEMVKKMNSANLTDLLVIQESIPVEHEDVRRCVQFALNQRLPTMLNNLLSSGTLQKAGVEPSEEAMSAVSISFIMKIDELFTETVTKMKGPPRPPVAQNSGCLLLLCMIGLALLGVLLAILP